MAQHHSLREFDSGLGGHSNSATKDGGTVESNKEELEDIFHSVAEGSQG